MPYSEEDKEIIRKLRSDNEQVVNEATAFLHNKYRNTVSRMVKNSGGFESEIQEILNDALLALIKKVQNGSYDAQQASLKTLFGAIAKNKRFDQLKKQYKEKEQVTVLDENSNIKDSQTSNPTEEFVFSKEEREKIVHALKKLDPACRELFEMKYWKGISLRDIAEKWNISEDAVKKRHERCKKKLKSLLEEDPRIR